jgi:Tfp pilus assembly protein PilF
MMTMYAYAIYVEHPSVRRYVLVFISFSLGLMAKPMLVTLPFVILLLDYWPLKRLQSPLLLVLEKVPLFIVTISACVATFITEQKSGALSPAEIYPLDVRMQNAIISYVAYIKKTIWPSNLAILYPYPVTLWPIEQVVVSGLVLVIISIIVVRWIYTYPYLAIGWFWYLGTLVPVIGFVQVGIPAMADRYTYVPLVGLFITITWGFPDLMRRWKHQKTLFSVTSVFVLVALMTCSWFQVLHWKNSISLFEHELKVTEGNFIAHNNLGIALKEQGRLDEAISHFHSSIQMKPTWQGYVNLGLTLTLQGRDDEAISVYEMVLRKEPNNADVHYILGNALVRRGKVDEAIAHFHRALQYRPDYSNAHYNLALALKKKGMNDKATFHFREAAHLKPAYKFSLP